MAAGRRIALTSWSKAGAAPPLVIWKHVVVPPTFRVRSAQAPRVTYPRTVPSCQRTGRIAVTVLVPPAWRKVNCTLPPTFTPVSSSGEAILKGIVMAGQPIAAIGSCCRVMVLFTAPVVANPQQMDPTRRCASLPCPAGEVDSITIERLLFKRRGSWYQLPHDYEPVDD